MSHNILIIHNPIAGQKKNVQLKEMLHLWSDDNLQFDYVETDYQGHAAKLTHKAIGDGHKIIVAAGGDGTVNEIASTLIHSDVSLGILPMGSGNGLARHHQISMDLKIAFNTLFKGKPMACDVGKINDKYFFCAAGIGFDALVSQKFANSKMRGLISYFLIALKEYFTYKSKIYSVHTNGKTQNINALFMTFANANQFGNHAYIAPQAKINDELIDVCILKPFPWYKGFQLAYRLFNKTIEKSSLYTSYKTNKVHIKSNQRLPFHYDGEIDNNQSLEVEISILPKALNIIVPEN